MIFGFFMRENYFFVELATSKKDQNHYTENTIAFLPYSPFFEL